VTDAATVTGPEAAPDDGSLLIEVRDLVAGYVPGLDILHGCSVELRRNEIVGIIGPNGAGKSTLLKVVFGLVPVRSGTVELRGDDITGLAAHALVQRGVGFVPQSQNVFASLTVEENLRMGLYQRPAKLAERLAFIHDVFPLVADRRKQRAGALSGGERQMVAMARALMMEPSVLLLDEPSAGLSPKIQEEAFARIQRINQAGVAVMMVEQNAHQCLRISHRAYVLDQGRDAYTGTGEDLLHDPKVVQLYLGTLARFE
jgi:branched-chain amino acid transport system ATP-binding protein